jgi:hypothetical protein
MLGKVLGEQRGIVMPRDNDLHENGKRQEIALFAGLPDYSKRQRRVVDSRVYDRS